MSNKAVNKVVTKASVISKTPPEDDTVDLAHIEKHFIAMQVIDNSSAWRMDHAKKLVVPEINANELTATDKIIANPNCSTIQMVVALAPLHKKYKIKRIVVSTYQSITGTGVKAVRQL